MLESGPQPAENFRRRFKQSLKPGLDHLANVMTAVVDQIG